MNGKKKGNLDADSNKSASYAAKRLFRLLGDVDDSLIEQVASAHSNRHPLPLGRIWIPAAACVMLAVAAGGVSLFSGNLSVSSDSPAAGEGGISSAAIAEAEAGAQAEATADGGSATTTDQSDSNTVTDRAATYETNENETGKTGTQSPKIAAQAAENLETDDSAKRNEEEQNVQPSANSAVVSYSPITGQETILPADSLPTQDDAAEGSSSSQPPLLGTASISPSSAYSLSFTVPDGSVFVPAAEDANGTLEDSALGDPLEELLTQILELSPEFPAAEIREVSGRDPSFFLAVRLEEEETFRLYVNSSATASVPPAE